MVFRKKRDIITALITPTDVVLDVGFWGQAVKNDQNNWPHRLLLDRAKEVHGVDLVYDESVLEHPERYQKASAEDFHFDNKFDVVFASELIEHLSNPGFFLDRCKEHVKETGKLILTTPNAFNLFTILEKVFKTEPSVNSDHTFYFNATVLQKLLEKNNWYVKEVHYYDSFKGSGGWKRALLRSFHAFVNLFTPKFMETLVIVAEPKK